MGALTYGFAHLGPHPLEPAEAVASEPTPPPTTVAPFEPEAVHETVTKPTPPLVEPPAPTQAVPPAVTEPVPVVVDQHEHETRESRTTERREALLGASSDEPPLKKAEPAQTALSFPEFTDSSRPAAREHAADGPRIDSLFERAEARPAQDPNAEPPRAPATDPGAAVVASSCEAAIARNNEQLEIGAARGAPDISREAYASILQNGRYLAGCSLPERTVFEICAAVKDGHAVGITVVSTPPNSKLNACVRSAVAHLKFPQNPRLDVTHTRFDASSR
jgi:hypothetical protein